MAVKGVAGEMPDSPRGQVTKDKVTAERDFLVETTEYTDDHFVVMKAVGIPSFMSIYPTFPMAAAKDFSAQRIKPNSLFWKVTVKYSTPDDDKDQHKDPRLDIPRVEISNENYQVAAFASDDADRSPLLNSASDPFDPQPTVDAVRMVLSITRNEDVTAPHPATNLLYAETINSDVFWGADPHMVKCKGISNSLEQRNLADGTTITYLKCTYVFHFIAWSVNGWDLRPLDIGPTYLTGINRVAFKTPDGHPNIGLLNGNGGASGTPPSFADATPTYLDPIQVYDAMPFKALNLPQSFTQVIPLPTGEKS
jgi:hypothetical protein